MYSLHYRTSGEAEECQFFPLDPQSRRYGYPQHDALGQDAQQVAEISNLGPQVYSVPDTPSSTPTRRSSRDLYAIFSDFLVLAVDMPTQSRPGTPLQIGAIYLLLFIRDRDPAKGFHSALYHHHTTHGGYKFNVKQMGSGWICDSAPNNGIMQSFLLDVALRIGFCDPGPTGVEALAWIDEVCLIEPPAPFDTFNCRTWTLHCVRGLVERGFVRCDDLDALEQGAKEWATLHHESAHDGVMPRPIEDSRVCTL